MAASILIVEDEELVAFTLTQILTDAGYQVQAATSAAEALARIAQHRFDVALLDLQIGADSGLTVLSALKRSSPSTVALVLTGYGSLETAIQAMREGAFDYLLKPCDIDELKAAIARGLGQRFQAIVQNAADIVIVVDEAAAIRYINPSIEPVLGYRSDELTGSTILTFLDPEDRVADGSAFVRRLVSLSPHEPVRVQARHRNGERRMLELLASDLRDDRSVGGVVLNARDITERTRAEDALRLLADASRVLAGSLDYQTTLAGVVRIPIPRFADWCAVHTLDQGLLHRAALAHRDPLTERHLEYVRSRYPLTVGAEHPVARVVRTGVSELYSEVPEAVLRAMAQDEEHLAILHALALESYIAVPLQARGRILGAMIFISARERRRYDGQDLTLAEELAQRAALAVDNARLYGEVQQGIRARDDFLSSVAHDLRTPLTSIKGFTQMLLRRLSKGDPPDSQALLEGLLRVDDSASKMTVLINMLVDLARLQLGQPLDLDRHAIDLVTLAKRVASERFRERQTIAFAADPPQVIGSWDPQRLERAVVDLLSNAVKYSADGSPIQLRIWREQDAAGDWALLSVHNEGRGIVSADLPHIFERFFRGANVAGFIDGAGMGLTDARMIAERHGGALSVQSTEGEGATAMLRLPLT